MPLQNPFRDFIDKTEISLYRWATYHRLSPASLYKIYNENHRPKRRLALRICQASHGILSLRDFGFED
jgi:hypothetical protein